MPTKQFDETISNFVQDLQITKEGIDKLKQLVLDEWKNRMNIEQGDTQGLQSKIQELETQKTLIGDKIPVLTSEIAIKMMEDKLIAIGQQVDKLKNTKEEKSKNDVDMGIVMEVVGYFLEHLN